MVAIAKIVRSILVKVLLALAAAGLVIYFSTNKIPVLLQSVPHACSQPITYNIGKLDSGFGISQAQFLSAIMEAQSVWEKAQGKQLFVYQANGKAQLEIDLIYNGIQSQTDSLAKLNKQINSNTKSYSQLKTEYDQQRALYDSKKSVYDTALSDYNQRKHDYETQVDYWNSRGGAPDAQFQKLQAQKQSLIQQQNSLNNQRQELDQIATNVNQLAVQLNQLASSHNSDVRVYNGSGLVGKEFNEGLYIVDNAGKRIEIYQFDSHAKLVRVLSHELGHALGLDHVDDPKAIMYRLNQSQNDVVTAADLNQLQSLCGKAAS